MKRFAKGAKAQLLIAFEQDEGVLPANPQAFLIPFNKSSMTSKTDMKNAETITGSRQPVEPIMGEHDVSGTGTVPVDARIFGVILKACFGDPVTTSISTKGFATGTAVNDTIATWNSVTKGAFNLTLDGTAKEVSGLDFSTCTDLTGVASKIQTAIRAAGTTTGWTGAVVSYDMITKTFKFTSGSIGSTSSIGAVAATTTSGATDISTMLCFKNATVVNGNTLYKHLYTIGDTMPSFVVEQGLLDVGTYSRFSGCKISKLSLTIDDKGELTADFDIMGMRKDQLNSSIIAGNSPIKLALQRLVSNNIASVTEGGNVLSSSKSFSIKVDFGLDGDSYFLGAQGYRGTVCEGLAQIDGEVQCLFEDSSLLDIANSNELRSLSVQGNVGNSSLKFNFPAVKYEETTPTIDGPKGISVNLSYHAYHDASLNNNAIEVELVNDVESY